MGTYAGLDTASRASLIRRLVWPAELKRRCLRACEPFFPDARSFVSLSDFVDSADDTGIGGTVAAASDRLNNADKPDIAGGLCDAADMVAQAVAVLRRDDRVAMDGMSVLSDGSSWAIGK